MKTTCAEATRVRRTVTVLSLLLLSLLVVVPSRHSHSLFGRPNGLEPSHRASDCPACVRENTPVIGSEAVGVSENGRTTKVFTVAAPAAASVARPARASRGPPFVS